MFEDDICLSQQARKGRTSKDMVVFEAFNGKKRPWQNAQVDANGLLVLVG
jgi:hypothetical protein